MIIIILFNLNFLHSQEITLEFGIGVQKKLAIKKNIITSANCIGRFSKVENYNILANKLVTGELDVAILNSEFAIKSLWYGREMELAGTISQISNIKGQTEEKQYLVLGHPAKVDLNYEQISKILELAGLKLSRLKASDIEEMRNLNRAMKEREKTKKKTENYLNRFEGLK